MRKSLLILFCTLLLVLVGCSGIYIGDYPSTTPNYGYVTPYNSLEEVYKKDSLNHNPTRESTEQFKTELIATAYRLYNVNQITYNANKFYGGDLEKAIDQEYINSKQEKHLLALAIKYKQQRDGKR